MTRSGRERGELGGHDPAERMPDDDGGSSDFELDERRDVGRVARGVVCVECGAARLTVTAQVDVPHVATQVTHDLAVREPAARQTVKEDDRRCVRIADAIEGEGLSGSQGGEHRSERYDQRVIRDDLSAAVRASLAALGVDPPAEIVLERPGSPEHGDWSTNVALATAKAAGRNPRELASQLARVAERRSTSPTSRRVEVAGPGFVNFHLRDTWLHEVLREVVEAGVDGYAKPDLGHGERVKIEFVSANPTGPLHVGNGWFASYGDALARLLERSGHEVTREYYVNDTGGQIRRFGASVLARKHGQPVPEDGYPGPVRRGPGGAVRRSRRRGRGRPAGAASRSSPSSSTTMESIHIHYDEWYSQASIEESGAVAETVEVLRAKGLVYEEDGATWLRTEDFGDPRKKRVAAQVQRRLHLPRRRHRLPPQQVPDPRVRPGDQRLGRGPPGPGAEPAGRGRGARRRPRPARGAARPDDLAGQRAACRSALGNAVDLDDARRRHRSRRDAAALAAHVDRLSATTIDLDKVREPIRENRPCTTCSTRTPASRRSTGSPPSAASTGRRSPTSTSALLVHERELDLLRTLFELPDVMQRGARPSGRRTR